MKQFYKLMPKLNYHLSFEFNLTIFTLKNKSIYYFDEYIVLQYRLMDKSWLDTNR
jgi:hypothetical protein